MTLSIGSIKANLHHHKIFDNDDKDLIVNTFNSTVTALNEVRQFMFKAIPLYIASVVHSPSMPQNTQQELLDPLIDSTSMLAVCDRLSALLSGRQSTVQTDSSTISSIQSSTASTKRGLSNDIADRMYKFLQDVVPLSNIVNHHGIIRQEARREMTSQVATAVRSHFINMWPILNEKVCS